MDRELHWEGCFNVRDLGGFATRDGGRTRRGALVRADGLHRLTDSGWSSLMAHGVRTVVDLRNDDEVEIELDTAKRPAQLLTVRVPIDDIGDRQFWEHVRANKLDGSPLYFRSFLEKKPGQCAAVLKAIAHAVPGGVVFHCGRGRDRTGLVALLALALVSVDAHDIVQDYEMSEVGVRRLDAALGREDQSVQIAEILQSKNISASDLIFELLDSIEIEEFLRLGGFEPRDVVALRQRFVMLRTDA